MSKEQGPRVAWVRLAANNLGCRHSGIKTCHVLYGGSVMSKEQGPCQPSLQLSPRGGESNRSPLPLGEGWGRGFAWVRLAANNLGCRHSGIKNCTLFTEAAL